MSAFGVMRGRVLPGTGGGGFHMDSQDMSQRLSRLSTQWTLIQQAHGARSCETTEAQRQLMHRYCGAVYRYLLGAVRNEDVAMDLCQDFALRFVRGDFRRATGDRGRFRDFVKTALRHLVTDYHRQRLASPQQLSSDPARPPEPEDDAFLASWRTEVLSKAWEALASSHPQLFEVLKNHTDRPDASAAELAASLSAGSDRAVSAGNVRVMLHRARGRFAELLVAEVENSLVTPTEKELQEELSTLGFLKLCAAALDRRAI